MNSSVLACNYAISGSGSSELNAKLASMPAVASQVVSGPRLPVIKAQRTRASDSKEMRGSEGRRAAMLYLAATLFTSAAATSSANAGVIEDYLERSKANKVCLQNGLFLIFIVYTYNHLFLSFVMMLIEKGYCFRN